MGGDYLVGFTTTVLKAFETVAKSFLGVLPEVIAAAFVLVIGWFAAAGLGRLVTRIISITKLDDVINKSGLDRSFEEASGMSLSLSKFIGWLVKWFVIVVVLIAVADILQLEQINEFLSKIALFIPNIIIAVVILLVGGVLGNFVHSVITRAVEASSISSAAGFLAMAGKVAVFIFAALAALSQLNIAKELIDILFTGLVGMLALAGGLAFGLGGKDAAKEFIEKMKREIE